MRDERGLPGTPGEHGPHEEVFVHEGGIGEFVEHLAVDAPVTDVWRLHGTGHFHETVPVLDALGHLEPTEVERECVVDVALRWGTGYDTTVRSFVNIIATPKGGTHLAGFEAVAAEDLPQDGRGERPAAQGRQRQAREGRRPGRA